MTQTISADECSAVEILQPGSLGNMKVFASGGYSRCMSGTRKDTGTEVVVKRNTIGRETSWLGSLKELSMLLRLGCHPFIVSLGAISLGNPFDEPLKPLRDKELRTDRLFFVYERAAYDGAVFAYGVPSPSYSFVKASMVQLLLAIEYMHAKGIVHRDIKPANMLWYRDGTERFMRLCDFGMSLYHTGQRRNSSEVVTSAYRAPEIVFRTGDDGYSYASDMWSAGCVMYEFVARRQFVCCRSMPASCTRENEQRALADLICSALPEQPSKEEIASMNYASLSVSEKCRTRARGLHRDMRMSSDSIRAFDSASLGGTYADLLDLLGKLLVLSPERRLTATQALDHPFFCACRDYIADCRLMYPPVPSPEPKCRIVSSHPLRAAGTNAALELCRARQSDEVERWYEHRTLFLGLHLFDRLLCSVPVEGSLAYDGRDAFLVCLYAALKFGSGMLYPPSFGEVACVVVGREQRPSVGKMAAYETLELKLLTLMGLDLRIPTVFEAADLFEGDVLADADRVDALLRFYIGLGDVEATPSELFRMFDANAQPLKANDAKPGIVSQAKKRIKRSVSSFVSTSKSHRPQKHADQQPHLHQQPGETTHVPSAPVLLVRTRINRK